MADGLIPDLAPNLYSQGQVGTGYAQVFDLGAPNPFAVTQDYINQTVANKKEAVKTAVANEEKRQQKLDQFLASIDDIDQPWNVAKVEIGNAINDYGEQIASMRAQGTPINSGELMKSQKRLKDLAKVNESNYQKAMKIGTEMQNPLIYSDQEREAFQEEIKKAANIETGGGVNKVQEVLDKWQKSVETPNVVEDYKKIFKAQRQDKSPYLSVTPEKGFKAAVNAQLESYKTPQLKKIFKEYQDGNRIPDGIAIEDLDNPDESIRNTALEAIRTEMEKDLTPYMEVEKSAYTGRTTTPKEPAFNIGTQSIYGDDTELSRINLSTGKGANVPAQNFDSGLSGEQSVYMIPQVLQFDTATSDAPEGWYIYGKVQQEKGTKPSVPGETAESVLASYGNPPGVTAELGQDGFWYFYELVQRRVPYELNKAVMQSYGINSLEEVAKNKKYKKIKRSSSTSGSQKTSANTQKNQIPVANQAVLDIDPNR